jgi:integrase/recombinase XerD
VTTVTTVTPVPAALPSPKLSAPSLAAAAKVVRDAVKDKAYRSTPIGLTAARYLRWKRFEWGATPATLRDYEIPLAYLSLDHADLELADFEPPHGRERIRAFLDARWGSRSPRTRAKNLSILRDFFRWAVENGYLIGDPTIGIRSPKKRQKSRMPFPPELVKKVVTGQPRLRDRVALQLLFDTGIRKSELCAVQFKHFDHAEHVLVVVGKGGKVRDVPTINPRFLAMLEQHILDRGAGPEEFLLYPERRGPRTDRTIGINWEDKHRPLSSTAAHRWWAGCLERAGVPHRPMHEARHTAITRFIQRTGNLRLAQVLAGHADVGTTAGYAHPELRDLKNALRALYEDD